MNILLISECSGNAVNFTRQILDNFSERRGERVWQTTITLAGLKTLHRLLRQKARKNTAVACYRMYGNQTELLWIVGSNSRFNERGAVPTNRSQKNILRSEDENNWHSQKIILHLTRLAALWHDVGKSCKQFQEILRKKTGKSERNKIRHEWVSLRLFEAFVAEAENDIQWLKQMADFSPEDSKKIVQRMEKNLQNPKMMHRPFENLQHLPLAQAVGWLIVSHHRLPIDSQKRCEIRSLKELPIIIDRSWNADEKLNAAEAKKYWTLPFDIFSQLGEKWQKAVQRSVRGLLENPLAPKAISDPFILHISRMLLMLADHIISAGRVEQKKSQTSQKLFANTDKNGNLKQPLAEHLLEVSQLAARFVYALPDFSSSLPRLVRHRALRCRSKDEQFRWQDKAADVCESCRENEGGTFILNMSSTGCGKTFANLRMLYALQPPEKGMRATFALGLRMLTQQTGKEYRKKLHLNDDELAICVGGMASSELYDMLAKKRETNTVQLSPIRQEQLEEKWAKLEERGLESSRSLFAEDLHILFEGDEDHPILQRLLFRGQEKKFLSAPLVSCTIDHLIPATESLRGGHQILPMLRLLGSDLVLDEIDDYGIEDLFAITRLVYWAGMLGSRVLISSATLPPDLTIGLFTAYRKGRYIFERNRGKNPEVFPPITCIWVDEFDTKVQAVGREQEFQHILFSQKRAKKVAEQFFRRTVRILEVGSLVGKSEFALSQLLATVLQKECCKLHAENCTEYNGQKVSFGVLRFANIHRLRQIAKEFCRLDAPENICFHPLIYHSRFPLAIRTNIEELLDRCLQRKDLYAVFGISEVSNLLRKNPDAEHIFLIFSSPVCEVGRDWDCDWAIVEPSSMRSLIQLAGRIRRHRFEAWDKINISLWSYNFKGLIEPKNPCFLRPGFEDEKEFQLKTHNLNELLQKEEYLHPNACPRLLSPKDCDFQTSLVALEHARLHKIFCPEPKRELSKREIEAGEVPEVSIGAYSWWEFPQSMLTGLLQQKQPFRLRGLSEIEFCLLPNEFENDWILTKMHNGGEVADKENLMLLQDFTYGRGVEPWVEFDVLSVMRKIAGEKMSLMDCGRKYFSLSLPQNEEFGFEFHSFFGFDKKY